MANQNDYLDLIPSANRQKAKFIAMVKQGVAVPVHIQNLLLSMIEKFDVEHAVGDQLDIIGQWAGVSRNVSIPVAGVYFSWDGTDPYLGWDFGSWADSLQPTTITTLPDDAYRTLIRARIAANSWDGTTEGAYAIWDEVFPTITILIQDYQNMSYDMAFVGGIIDALTLALLTGGYIPLKPEAIRINNYITPVDDSPLFAWDTESDFLAGWDAGSWGRETPAT